MKYFTTSFLLSVIIMLGFAVESTAQVRINEVRADDESTDDAEFIELIGVAGTDLTGYQIIHYNGAAGTDSDIFTHTIGSFTIPNDGITDSDANNLGFYVLGAGGFTTGTDESTGTSLQNGPDGIVLYDDEGNIVDAVAWDGAGDLTDDDPGTVTTSGSASADNYLHVTSSDDSGDNSLQAPDDVLSDDGSGWTVAAATIGAINSGQTSGSIILSSSVKAQPANQATAFTATGIINSVNLSWTDAIGSPAPDAYLIKASTTSFAAISDPSDGTAESDDTDLSDGAGVVNVAFGAEAASFTGLNETTQYFFKIYAYTNTGVDIDYLLVSPPQDDGTTLETPDIVLNEILSNPDGQDANGDGNSDNSEDEFLEFVNTGTTDLDISNWTIEDPGSGTTHTFTDPTVLSPFQGIVVFGGGTPTGDFGGSITQIAGNLGLNNPGDDVILKNDSGIEIIDYTYSGATGESETRNPDLTGSFVDHTTADNGDNSSFSPGTRVNGDTFDLQREISGSAGWRMLSMPVADATVETISDDTPVQGITGGDDATDAANFYINQASDGNDGDGFTEPATVTTAWGDGYGYILYFFNNTTNGSEVLPDILDAQGLEPSGDVTVTISDLYTLVGNPYSNNITLDSITGNDSGQGVNDGLVSPVSVWDDAAAENGTGSYVTYNFNESPGEVIRTWQGFFVQRNSASTTQLTIPESAKTNASATVEVFAKQSSDEEDVNNRKIELLLEAPEGYADKSNKLYFTPVSGEGVDAFDGSKLNPLNGSPFLAFVQSVDNEDKLFVQDSRALNPDTEQLYDLYFNDAGFSGEFTISWPVFEQIPEEWNLTFHDYETGEEIDMKDAVSYSFDIESSQKRAVISILTPLAIEAQVAEEITPRFGITLQTKTNVSNEHPEQPETFRLEQNFPNPFNPTTSIRYSVAESGAVSITVYNVMGQEVSTLVQENKTPGTYQVSWDASDMASGIYYYRLRSAGEVLTRQMTLIK